MSEDGQEAEGRKTLTKKLGGTTDEQLLAEFTGADAENLSYDFFKNMSSLSVLTLGGILTLSEGLFAERIEFWQMMFAAVLIAGGGIVALQCHADIVQMAGQEGIRRMAALRPSALARPPGRGDRRVPFPHRRGLHLTRCA